ncbi:acyltransferase [Dysgonomonas sp. 520]|uniref:acyltransferase family protein n=1 Tax=Dysgonomonas sp. 520 TaxID=2302931 RepID=UPI0013D8BDA3|nr:acyltransferase [Dysgonomonas sp. 520]NDW10425.1 acyltransferase [Dysgonomonas sp. 520]
MTKYFSDKIRCISFVSMVMVVILHSYNVILNTLSGSITITKGYNYFIQTFISQGIVRVAVPLFFLISGYLFFRNINTGAFNEFLQKYKTRFKSLVIPYLFWSIWCIFLYLILQSIPASKPFFTTDLIRDYSFSDLLNRIFITPLPYQFWFVRDLVIWVILSPLVYRILKYTKALFLIIGFIAWSFEFDFVIFTNISFFFFLTGSYLGINRVKFDLLLQKDFKYTYLFVCLWLITVTVFTCLTYIDYAHEWVLVLFYKTSTLVGIVALWFGYDKIYRNKDISKKWYFPIFKYSFFIYVIHEPMMVMMRKGLYSFLGFNQLSSFIIYFAAPLIVITFAISVGALMRRFLPKIYAFVTGER